MIKIENVSKIFHSGTVEIRAIDNLSFSIPAGQFVTISGKSGSGKSTLLYQMGLLDEPTSGSIKIDDQEMVGLNEEERTLIRLNDLGYIFQDYAVIPTLTALENVMVPLLMQGDSQNSAKIKSISAMEKIGLGDKLDNLPSQLSGGQQQRVAIARAIAHNPKIIFADEPTANLDSETSDQVMKTFIQLNKEGQTIIMVTHEPDYAKMADRTIYLTDGKITEDITYKK